MFISPVTGLCSQFPYVSEELVLTHWWAIKARTRDAATNLRHQVCVQIIACSYVLECLRLIVVSKCCVSSVSQLHVEYPAHPPHYWLCCVPTIVSIMITYMTVVV